MITANRLDATEVSAALAGFELVVANAVTLDHVWRKQLLLRTDGTFVVRKRHRHEGGLNEYVLAGTLEECVEAYNLLS